MILGLLTFVCTPLCSMEQQHQEVCMIQQGHLDPFSKLHNRIRLIEEYIDSHTDIPLEEKNKAENELTQARISLHMRLEKNDPCFSAADATALFAAKARIGIAERILGLPGESLKIF